MVKAKKKQSGRMKENEGVSRLPIKTDTPRFLRFRELYLETGNAMRAAIDAGYGKKSAQKNAHRLAARVSLVMADALRAAGVDERQLAERLKRKLDAKETRFFQFQGRVEETRSVIDHATQLKAIELCLRIFNAFPRLAENEPGSGGRPIGLILDLCPQD